MNHNNLVIQVVEVKVRGSEITKYGFIAKDFFETLTELNYNSLKAFKRMYPTKKSLIEKILSTPEFSSCASFDYDTLICEAVNDVIVEGYPEDNDPQCVDVRQMKDILNKNGFKFDIISVTYLSQSDCNTHKYHITFLNETHNEHDSVRVSLNFNPGGITAII